MIRLVLRKSDGNIYADPYFDNLEAAEAWYNEEITRPYWDHTIVPEYENVVVPDIEGDKATHRAEVEAKRDEILADLPNVDSLTSVVELRAFVKKIAEFVLK